MELATDSPHLILGTKIAQKSIWRQRRGGEFLRPTHHAGVDLGTSVWFLSPIAQNEELPF